MPELFGRECAVRFHKRMSNAMNTIDRALEYAKIHNRLTSELSEKLTAVVKESENSSELSMDAFRPILLAFGLTGFSSLDVVALTKFFGGKYSVLAFKEMYKHHPLKFKIMKEIYFLLKELKLLSDKDNFNLVIGRTEPMFNGKFKYLGREGNRQLFESDSYVFKVGHYLNLEDWNHKEARLWTEWHNEILCPIEFIYPDKNVLVFPKCDRDLTEEQVTDGMVRLLTKGWKLDTRYEVKYELKDFAFLNGDLVMFNYSTSNVDGDNDLEEFPITRVAANGELGGKLEMF
jgi:hypothetical protein